MKTINIQAGNFNIEALTPKINLNGSSSESLMNIWQEFYDQLEETRKAFPFESFHGRNFIGHDQTVEEVRTMIGMIEDMQKICEEVSVGILNQ